MLLTSLLSRRVVVVATAGKSRIINNNTSASVVQFIKRYGYYSTTSVLSIVDTTTTTTTEQPIIKFAIPKRTPQKVISASDAVALIASNDTIYVSGFVCQGAPELVLKALGERYNNTGYPTNLTLLFGGGPGDYGKKGLNHLAKTKPLDDNNYNGPMLKRTIGGHYGQVPEIAKLVLSEQVEAWTLPMGSISRMVRSQSTHSPGHITTVGLGTYVDPDIVAGATNESARNSEFNKKLVTKITLDETEHLVYKALPIDVAIIRGTTADTLGNISIEHESLKADQMIAAAAARNSGGITIAQVKRVAATGSLPSRSVEIPGSLVDCVVVVNEEDHDELHPMSYLERNNPVLTGEIKTPKDSMERMKMNVRKLIGRRAFLNMRMNTCVNLGIGLPEAIAPIAAEEGLLEYITLTTEPGVFGGLPASGHSFGPAYNSDAFLQMNQMFDFYDGGGLDMCFLGAAQISKNGDVNVSRMSKDRLTGPGGFIDITQSTQNICFLCPFTAKGLEVNAPGDGTLQITQEGQVPKFVNEVFEKTFSGDEAVRRGQSVFYVTERAVFRRRAQHDTIELIEIADGIDLQKDILDQMGFEPVISPDLKKMDKRIFIDEKMDVGHDFFGSLEDRYKYNEDDHRIFWEFFGITINTLDDLRWFANGIEAVNKRICKDKGKVAVVANYHGFDCSPGLEDQLAETLQDITNRYYRSIKRYTGAMYKRAKLGGLLSFQNWDIQQLFKEFDKENNNKISLEELRAGLEQKFDVHLSGTQIEYIRKHYKADTLFDLNDFEHILTHILKDDLQRV